MPAKIDWEAASAPDLAAFEERSLVDALGAANGRHLHRLANAIDDRSVEPDQQAKSISHEETFATDRTDRRELEVEAVRMADAVAQRLRDRGWAGRTVTIKVRFHDFRTITRSTTLPDQTDLAADIASSARALLDAVDLADGIRLLGVSMQQLDDATAVQEQLPFAAVEERKERRALESAMDAVRERFGQDAILPGTGRGETKP